MVLHGSLGHTAGDCPTHDPSPSKHQTDSTEGTEDEPSYGTHCLERLLTSLVTYGIKFRKELHIQRMGLPKLSG
jgi:hypothetical protein